MMPPLSGSSFRCSACAQWASYTDLNLDARDRPVCGACYVANPTREDVEGVFAEVMAHMEVK